MSHRLFPRGREQWRVFWTRGKFPYVFNCSRKSMEDFTRERVTRGFKVLKVRSESGDWIWEWVEGKTGSWKALEMIQLCFCLKCPADLRSVLSEGCPLPSSVLSEPQLRPTGTADVKPVVTVVTALLQLGRFAHTPAVETRGPTTKQTSPQCRQAQFPCTQRPVMVMLTHSSLPPSDKQASLVMTSSSYTLQEFVSY